MRDVGLTKDASFLGGGLTTNTNYLTKILVVRYGSGDLLLEVVRIFL